MAGKSVRLFLVDGTPQGLRTAEVGNWTGLAVVCPRTALADLGKREEVRATGVYLLLGPSEDLGPHLRVYVGEADDVWSRLQTHDSKKDFWTWVVVFVAKDENLTKAHVRWLEARIVREVSSAKQAQLENGTEPTGGRLPEADAADMEVYFENIRLLLPTLGADILTAGGSGRNTDAGVTLELAWDEARAECVVRDGKFIVSKGSTARAREVESLAQGARDNRARLVEEGVLAQASDGLLHFTQDYTFDSPTAAAVVVAGTPLNGRSQWKLKGQGVSYKDWQEAQLRKVQNK
jgi:hypothetical protein